MVAVGEMTSLRSERLVVRCCTEFGDLQALAEAWNNLVDDSAYPNVFLRWEWVGTWWKYFGGGRPLRVYLVYDGSQLVGILPLYARRRALCGISRRMVLAPIGFGGPTCPEYLGLIVHREALEAVVQRLAAELRSPDDRWTAIELPDVAPDDRGTHALVEALAAEYPSLATPGVRCPAIFLPDSYEALLGRLSSHRRQREKYQVRRTKRECAAEVISIESSKQVEDVFPLMIELSASSCTRAGHASPFSNARYACFHREIMARMSETGLLKLFVLELHGQPAAYVYGFLYDSRYSFFQTGFDSQASRYSPGDVILQMTFQELIREGVREFDYLRGEESYKYVFADHERQTTSFFVFRSLGLGYLSRRVRVGVVAPFRRKAKVLLLRVRNRLSGKGSMI